MFEFLLILVTVIADFTALYYVCTCLFRTKELFSPLLFVVSGFIFWILVSQTFIAFNLYQYIGYDYIYEPFELTSKDLFIASLYVLLSLISFLVGSRLFLSRSPVRNTLDHFIYSISTQFNANNLKLIVLFAYMSISFNLCVETKLIQGSSITLLVTYFYPASTSLLILGFGIMKRGSFRIPIIWSILGLIPIALLPVLTNIVLIYPIVFSFLFYLPHLPYKSPFSLYIKNIKNYIFSFSLFILVYLGFKIYRVYIHLQKIDFNSFVFPDFDLNTFSADYARLLSTIDFFNGEAFSVLAHVLNFYTSNINPPYNYGNTFLSPLIGLNNLGFETISFAKLVGYQLMNSQVGANVVIPVGLIGESFANFESLAPPLIFFFLGIFTSLLYSRFDTPSSSQLILYASFLCSLFLMQRGDFFDATVYPAIFALDTLILFHLSRLRFHNKPNFI